jgi:hypothetical protein
LWQIGGGGKGCGGKGGKGGGHTPEPEAYAFDCEFIKVRDLASGQINQKAVCSIGVVDDRLEKILYTRIKKPLNSEVVDDSFVRTRGGLHPDWNKGITPLSRAPRQTPQPLQTTTLPPLVTSAPRTQASGSRQRTVC